MQSQCDAILEALQATPGQWVAMPALVDISGSYNIHSRIDELRHERGIAIENKVIRGPIDRRRHYSFYRVPSPV